MRAQARYPRLARFLAARLTRGSGTGLGLTVGVILAGVVAWFFLELLIEVASGNPITGADRRIINSSAARSSYAFPAQQSGTVGWIWSSSKRWSHPSCAR
jgi:hypothetical protein